MIDVNQQWKVSSATFFKSGQSTGKDGQPRTWTMYDVTLEGYNGSVKGFDAVNPGDMVTLTESQNGQYVNVNYKAVKAGEGQPAASAAPAPYVAPGAQPAATAPATSDKRILELLVVMAEQMAIPAETIKGILENK